VMMKQGFYSLASLLVANARLPGFVYVEFLLHVVQIRFAFKQSLIM